MNTGGNFLVESHNKNEISHNGWLCKNHFINKFSNDKIFYDNINYIVILDGVILNKKEIQQDSTSWIETLINLYVTQGEDFFKIFRGVFAGAIYDKNKDKWIIFSDHFGQKFIYYSYVGNSFICSSVITNIYDYYKESKQKLELDTTGVSFLLSYGFMLDNYTLCKDIKKIRPGCYLTYQNGKLEEKEYYKLDNTPDYNITYDKAIDELDRLFRNAINLQFLKDEEYGYKHICALSGGLDCRMTSYVAHTMGYQQQLNVTFSESDYWDSIIPQAMAIDWKHDWLFKPLDNGTWLMDVDEITKTTGGNVIYYGSAHGNSLYKNINFTDYGILHSGQLGDVVLATCMKDSKEEYKFGMGAYSTDKFKTDYINPEFKNKEIGLWYCRYLNGTNNGLQNTYNYTETCSPFLDVDFVNYCFSLPVSYRYNHKIYKDWMLKKYPEATKYVWASTGALINEKIITIRGRRIPSQHVFNYLFRKFKEVTGITKKKYSMQQLDDYIQNNQNLTDFMATYTPYIDAIKDQTLKDIINNMLKDGTSYEKIQAVTLLSAIKLYFS